MPRIHGRKLVESIKVVSAQTPVILLTAWAEQLLASKELPPHVDRVVGKPPPPARRPTRGARHCSVIAPLWRLPRRHRLSGRIELLGQGRVPLGGVLKRARKVGFPILFARSPSW